MAFKTAAGVAAGVAGLQYMHCQVRSVPGHNGSAPPRTKIITVIRSSDAMQPPNSVTKEDSPPPQNQHLHGSACVLDFADKVGRFQSSLASSR